MASFLLSTRALYEFVAGKQSSATKFREWCQALGPKDLLFASEISLGELRWSVEQIESPKKRDDWRHNLDKKIPAFFKSQLLPFRHNEVREWGLIRLVGNPPLPAEETQIIGQAIANELTLVTSKTPVHVAIGCSLMDPYGGKPWPM